MLFYILYFLKERLDDFRNLNIPKPKTLHYLELKCFCTYFGLEECEGVGGGGESKQGNRTSSGAKCSIVEQWFSLNADCFVKSVPHLPSPSQNKVQHCAKSRYELATVQFCCWCFCRMACEQTTPAAYQLTSFMLIA